VSDDGCLLPRMLRLRGLNGECRTWAVWELLCYMPRTRTSHELPLGNLSILTTSSLSVWPLQGRRSWEEVSKTPGIKVAFRAAGA
jgi:hypothetical protein